MIWEDLGPDFTAAEHAQAVLRRWAGHATSFFDLGENLNKLFTFEPAAVRSLLAEHPALLGGAGQRLVARRHPAVARCAAARQPPHRYHPLARDREGLGAGWVEVGLLTDAEALDLFDLRLGWRPQRARPADGWAFGLAGGVGMHAPGLDVALGVLRRYGDSAAEWRPAAGRLLRELGSGRFDRLRLGDDDPGHNAKAVMMFSYEALKGEAQSRFRRLAAFAAEADFTTAAAAAAWGCEPDDAFETLTDFANVALLERRGGAWRQHALLPRLFSLALLRDAGETDPAAAAYAARLHRYYTPHGGRWTISRDAARAATTAPRVRVGTWERPQSGGGHRRELRPLQRQFGLVQEGADWSERVLAAAQARAAPETLACAWGQRGNVLLDLARLPGEDRRAHLLAALAAYDKVLQFQRSDIAPLHYAATQSNRIRALSELAELPGEDRRDRILAALEAIDEALKFSQCDGRAVQLRDYAQQSDELGSQGAGVGGGR